MAVNQTHAMHAKPSEADEREALEDLDTSALGLPSLVTRGLEANERAKYLLSLLQAARNHADNPSQPSLSLSEERTAAGLADPELDTVVEQARRDAPDLYLIPGAGRLHRLLVESVQAMLDPFAAAPTAPDGRWVQPARLASLVRGARQVGTDQVTGAYIDQLTSARRDGGDSMHLLVMDAHRDLLRLQAAITTQSVEGAAVYNLADGDAEMVAAFMAGLHETSPLRFDHPGLGTVATRAGSRLLIHNDLGTTRAHVVVLSVEGLMVRLTYSDIHPRRLEFFASLFESSGVRWSNAAAPSSKPSPGQYQIATGLYQAHDGQALKDFLQLAGSRLVFVLDWNRARKRLSGFLPTKDAIGVLHWAADANVGHMAWLKLGGERLIYDAVELAAKVPARYGEPLIDVLGREQTLALTRFALRTATEGLLADKSARLILDELRVEVLRHVQASQRRLLDVRAEHATMVVECARVLQAAMVRLGGPGGPAFLGRAARRAAALEHRADEVLIRQRQEGRRVEGSAAVTAMTATADDAIDALEEAVFLLTLLPPHAVEVVRQTLEPVAATAVLTAREHFKAVQIARSLFDRPVDDDLEDFLVAVDQVSVLEHAADEADRSARASLVSDVPDFRSLYLADGISRGVEDAIDALLRSTLGLRDHVLAALSRP